MSAPNTNNPAPNVPFRLGHPWPGLDPFLFTAFHADAYPAGDESMGPSTGTAGRVIGQDFSGVDGWSMYHGSTVPGFPAHPHRGFETITIANEGLVDHTDSTGATARYGEGDVQWLTAGGGVSHSEMFPLVKTDEPNPMELFQIWVNLPPEGKSAPPEFTMQWAERIPVWSHADEEGRTASVKVIAGELDGVRPLDPPVNSWGANPDADLAVWMIDMEPGAETELPAAATDGTRRTFYVFEGDDGVAIEGANVPKGYGYLQVGRESSRLVAGRDRVRALVLQGVPIGAPVAHRGPFVMNTPEELNEAYAEYRRTQFGGWPWATTEEVHPRDRGRFARLSDGTEITPGV